MNKVALRKLAALELVIEIIELKAIQLIRSDLSTFTFQTTALINWSGAKGLCINNISAKMAIFYPRPPPYVSEN